MQLGFRLVRRVVQVALGLLLQKDLLQSSMRSIAKTHLSNNNITYTTMYYNQSLCRFAPAADILLLAMEFTAPFISSTGEHVDAIVTCFAT